MTSHFNRFAYAMGQSYRQGFIHEDYDIVRWHHFLSLAYSYVMNDMGADPGPVSESYVYYVLGQKGKGKSKGKGIGKVNSNDVSMGRGKGNDPGNVS